jgi:hypothetical protein
MSSKKSVIIFLALLAIDTNVMAQANPNNAIALQEIRSFLKDNEKFIDLDQAVAAQFQLLLQSNTIDKEQASNAHALWIDAVYDQLKKANYKEAFFTQKDRRCVLFTQLIDLYQQEILRLDAQLRSINTPWIPSEKQAPLFTYVDGAHYINKFAINTQENILKIEHLPMVNSIVEAEAISGECGENKFHFYTFDSASKQGNLFNKFMNSVIPQDLQALKQRRLSYVDFMQDHFNKENAYSYSYFETIYFIGHNYLSFGTDTNIYSGGAHGNYSIAMYAFDVKNKKLLKLEDIIKDNDIPGFLAIAKQHFAKSAHVDTNAHWKAAGYWFNKKDSQKVEPKWLLEDGFYLPKNFAIDNHGITFLYQSYEIAPYSYGAPSFTIPWDQLKPYLKQQDWVVS